MIKTVRFTKDGASVLVARNSFSLMCDSVARVARGDSWIDGLSDDTIAHDARIVARYGARFLFADAVAADAEQSRLQRIAANEASRARLIATPCDDDDDYTSSMLDEMIDDVNQELACLRDQLPMTHFTF